MPNLYLPTVPVRAERYQPGMTHVLGLPVVSLHGVASVFPHTVRCRLSPGDWLVETTLRLINTSGTVEAKGLGTIVLADAEFRARYRLATPDAAVPTA